MFGDVNIDLIESRLGQFKLNDQGHQTELQAVLGEYSSLLQAFKSLNNAYEDSIAPKGNRSSKDPKNSYALVLVDGNGYIFNDELIKEKEDGGIKAARLLNDAVESFLRAANISVSRVMVRIYADMTTLSKNLGKSKLTGLEKRSLGDFAAGFTRFMGHFDFVDAMDEDGTRFKIGELFKMAAEDSSCSHVLYAACHDVAYTAPLAPYTEQRNKVTLLQGAGFKPEFCQYGFNSTSFPTVFRWSELRSSAPTSMVALEKSSRLGDSIASPKSPSLTSIPSRNHGLRSMKSWRSNSPVPGAGQDIKEAPSSGWGRRADTDNPSDRQAADLDMSRYRKVPCRYFAKGNCNNGDDCTFLHSKSTEGEENTNETLRPKPSSQLPPTILPGFVALNQVGHRLDTVITYPAQEDRDIYNERCKRQKPCTDFHLQKGCGNFKCAFDHTDLEPGARRVMAYMIKGVPCRKKGDCRDADCIYGHLCQKDNCSGPGFLSTSSVCKFGPDLHNIDTKVASMVQGEQQEVVYGNTAESDPESDSEDGDGGVATWY